MAQGDNIGLSRLSKLQRLKANVLDCINEGIDMGDLVARVSHEIQREKEALRWSGVYSLVDGCAQDLLYEGTEADCADFTHHHQELHGKCIISPLF